MAHNAVGIRRAESEALVHGPSQFRMFVKRLQGLIPRQQRVGRLYLPGRFERVIAEFGVPAKSRTLPPLGIKASGTPQQMKALFDRIGMVPGFSMMR